MEGGVALLLLIIIAVVVGVIGLAMYLTGGTLWAGKTSKQGDRTETGPNAEPRPEHKQATSPTVENTEVVGAAEARKRDG